MSIRPIMRDIWGDVYIWRDTRVYRFNLNDLEVGI